MSSSRLAALLLFAGLPVLIAGPAVAQEARLLSGTALYLARIALPPDAEIAVEAQDFSGRSLGFQSRATDGAQVPLPFEVEIPASVSAELRVALSFGGGVRWLSDAVAIAPGSGPLDLGELVLHAHTPMGFSSELTCGDRRFRVGFSGEKALLDTGSAVIELDQAISASGARFLSADETTEFWTKGDWARLTIDGTELPECRFVPPEPAAGWRATGNEPFWAVDISGGRITLTGPGADQLEAALPEPGIADGAFLYRIEPEGSEALALTVTETICRDTMTGMPHPQTVTLRRGDGPVLNGCGGSPLKLLTGAEWQVEDIGGGGIIDRSNLTLQVLPDGHVAGSSGCNRFTGALVLTGESLSLGPLAGTMMACAESLMAQEARFHAALSSVDGFDIDDTGALLLKSAGETVLLARR